MGTIAETRSRREKISICLAKSMTSPTEIAKEIGESGQTVRNDLLWMKKNSRKWLSGHTLDGYVFQTKITIDKFDVLEQKLQNMLKESDSRHEKLRIIHELADIINMKWVIMGEGPVRMNRRYVNPNATA